MKLKINKNHFYLLLYILCVIVPFFNNYELTFTIWLVTMLFTFKRKYSIRFLIYISLFGTIFLVAISVGAFRDYSAYFIIRDITYLLKPIIGLLIGYQLYRFEYKKPFFYIIYAGVVIASYHLLLVVKALLFESVPNMHVLRYYAGFFNDFEIYVLIILIFNKPLGIEIDRKRRIYFLILLALSSFFYLARTNFIQFAILYMAMKGFFTLNKRNLIILSSFLILTGLMYAAVYQYNPSRKGKGIEAFLYKIKNSPLEAFKTKVNKENWKDFHDNYRAYENIRTIEQVSLNNTVLFGEGIGSQVDLKQEVFLGDMYLRKISILHNGFMTVLIKTGAVGVLIYLMSIFFFFKNPHANSEHIKSINMIFVGTGVFLIISNWVFMGFYNLLDTKILIIGFLFAYRENCLKKELTT